MRHIVDFVYALYLYDLRLNGTVVVQYGNIFPLTLVSAIINDTSKKIIAKYLYQ